MGQVGETRAAVSSPEIHRIGMPGYISHKAYVADDGERLTLFEWESADTLQAWATHPEHKAVKKLGRERFYTEYRAQICQLVRESKFRA